MEQWFRDDFRAELAKVIGQQAFDPDRDKNFWRFNRVNDYGEHSAATKRQLRAGGLHCFEQRAPVKCWFFMELLQSRLWHQVYAHSNSLKPLQPQLSPGKSLKGFPPRISLRLQDLDLAPAATSSAPCPNL